MSTWISPGTFVHGTIVLTRELSDHFVLTNMKKVSFFVPKI